MKIKTSNLITLIAPVLLLAACGGGSTDSSTVGNKTVSGTLVEPDTSIVSANKAIRKSEADPAIAAKIAAQCPEIPNGYSPLVNASVRFIDDTNNDLTNTTTDQCGFFSASVPESTTQIIAASPDNEEIIADVAVFEADGSQLASALPLGASYQIASLQKTSDSKLSFTVTDTQTNKAVIGIPDAAFSLALNANPLPIDLINNATSLSDPASVVLVLDASGSMSSFVYDENGNALKDANDNYYNRRRMTAIAAHTYLDGISSTDETGVVIFDHYVDFITNQLLGDSFALTDVDGNSATYTFSSTGFSSSPSNLRFVVDLYNRDSALWPYTQYDDRHSDTPNLSITNYYRWGGSTSLYDAILEGVSRVQGQANARKILVAMSDGGDNASVGSEQDAIDAANAAGVSVYTIAYGSSSNETTMQNIAQGTNASYYSVDNVDIAAAFQHVQTAITFQYLAGFSSALNTGDTLTLSLNHNGESISRDITVQ